MAEEITLGLAIIAVVKQVKDNYPQVNGLGTLAIAVLLGGVAGYFGVEGLTIYGGIMTGIAAVGAHTAARAAR